MAYGLKYILRYETERYGTDIRLLIYEKDYTGPEIKKRIGAGHIQLTKNRDDKISGSTLDFSIQADANFEYANFFTLDNKAHKVELEFNWGVCWTGYIVADQYSEPYIAPPYDVQIMATDGLGLLKNEKFELTGMRSRFEAIRYCIDKIGIQLRYAININIWEQNMDQDGHNMLDQLYFNADIFADKTCYEVINSLLPENCIINQANSFWIIERPTDRTLDRYIFDSSGNPTNDTYDWHTYIRHLGSVEQAKADHSRLYPIGSLTFEMQSAWRKFTVKQLFGKRESFFKNHNFATGKSFWTDDGLGEDFYIKNENSKNYAVIQKYNAASTKSISQSIDVISTSACTLEINYAIIATMNPDPKYAPNVKFKLKLVGQSGASYYLDQSGWNTTAKDIIVEKVTCNASFPEINFQTLKIVAIKLPESGTLTLKIFQAIPSPNIGPAYYDLLKGLCIEKAIFVNNDITQFNDSEETTVVLNENTTESEKTIEFKPVDIPDYDNAELFFDNGNYLKLNGKYVRSKKWGSAQKTYLEYMSAYMAYLYQNPRSILKGEISGWLELNSYIDHALTGKIYFINSGTWNVLEHTFNLELIELPDGEFIYDDYAQELPEPFTPTFDIDDTDVNHAKTIDGSFEAPLAGTSTPVIVARKQTIDPHKLDFDSGTPQFSLMDAEIETNIDGNANTFKINAGQIISHHYAALNRTDIRFIKEVNEPYDPTRSWDIAEQTIELPDDDGVFLYIKVPLAEELPE